jgi:hypothetical protein
MVSNAFHTQPPLPAAAPVTEPEPAAYDRPLRGGVLDGLRAPRWVAKILQDINRAPFLTLSLVIVDASDDPPTATWRAWLARQRAVRSTVRPRNPALTALTG